MHCEFFRECSNACVLRLVHAFRFAVFLAGDVMSDEGDVSKEMMFLSHGEAKMTKRGRRMPLQILEKGRLLW